MAHKVLIIEDNVDLADNIYLLLRELGFEAFYAHNGEKGLTMIMEMKPEIILCDIMLPDINGYKLLTELKKLEEKIVPIFIFMTAKTQRDDIRRGMTTGADDYLTKPFTNEELINTINAQLKKREKILKKMNELSGAPKIDNSESIRNDAEPASLKTKLNYNDHIFIGDKKNPGFYLVKEIILIRSFKDYTRIQMSDGKKFLMRKPMIYWVRTLPKGEFIRIHRQTIVNLNFVGRVEPSSSNRYSIFMKNALNSVSVSQRYSKKIKQILG